MVITGAYPGADEGPGPDGPVRGGRRGRGERAAATPSTRPSPPLEAIPAPFDQHLADGVPDDDPGRASVLAGIEALEAQADDIVAAADVHRGHRRGRDVRLRRCDAGPSWLARRPALVLVVVRAAAATARRSLDADLGGDTTRHAESRNSLCASRRPNLSTAERRRFEVGDSFFTKNWVTAPASTDARDGLGPDVQRPGVLVVPRARRAGRAARSRRRPMPDSGCCCGCPCPGETADRRAGSGTPCTAASCRTGRSSTCRPRARSSVTLETIAGDVRRRHAVHADEADLHASPTRRSARSATTR